MFGRGAADDKALLELESLGPNRGAYPRRIVAPTFGVSLGRTQTYVLSTEQGSLSIRATVEVKTADAMEKTADFLKTHDSRELMTDLEEFVKAHPLQATAPKASGRPVSSTTSRKTSSSSSTRRMFFCIMSDSAIIRLNYNLLFQI